MSFYPSFEEIIGREDKKNLLEVRRSLLSIISNFALFLFLLAIVYGLNAGFENHRLPASIPLLHNFSLRWLSVIPALMLLEIVRKYHNDLYIFGNERITHYQGRLSLRSSRPSLRYHDILAVRVKQDIWGRIFDYGNVELDTAASTDVELTMQGVRAPGEVAQIVDQLRILNVDQNTPEQGAGPGE